MARKSKTKPPTVPAKPYEPNEREKASLAAFDAGRNKHKPFPVFKLVNETGNDLTFQHSDEWTAYCLQAEALGVRNEAVYCDLVQSLGDLTTEKGKVNVRRINAAISMMAGIGPRDQLESMLAAQMAAVHLATMTFAKRLARVENIPQQDSAGRTFNKLARTFAAQVEALKRYRSKGEQRVYVERVNVEKGGQTIVGQVTHGGGGGACENDR